LLTLAEQHPLAAAVADAITKGEIDALRRLLQDHPGLAQARLVKITPKGEEQRSLLHLATDWPGHFPNAAATIATLIAAGADPNAPFVGPHAERPLHWAASNNDLAALDALLDHGADIEAPGSIFARGTALADAVAFAQWDAARRLIERGARSNLWQSAALGLMDRVRTFFTDGPPPPDEITQAFWLACHGGRRDAAEYFLARGADLNWIGYDRLTPLDAARRSGALELAAWLESHGARSAR
jgi:ankyrin repeat protein